uniref:Putative secreted peptide n=1 Tax=Anopheles braziliensis TaxID=58242 RepID=A0A2M3ZTC7_9DIPT
MQQRSLLTALLANLVSWYRVVPFVFPNRGSVLRQGRVGIIYSNLTSSFYWGHVLWLRLPKSRRSVVIVPALKLGILAAVNRSFRCSFEPSSIALVITISFCIPTCHSSSNPLTSHLFAAFCSVKILFKSLAPVAPSPYVLL